MDYERLKALQADDPEQFRQLLKEISSKTVRPHPGQIPVIQSNARFKVMNCGRRFGKTVIAAHLMIRAARKPNQMVWWVAPSYRVVKRGYEQILKQLPEGLLAKPAPPESHFDAGRQVVLHFKNGTKMEFFSAERPEGMLGAAVDFVVLDEAATMPSRIWNQIVSPTLIDHKGSALLISTPRGRNWFYQLWKKGQDSLNEDYESWTFTTQDNPTLPEGEADRMAADMPRMEADQEIYAKWIASGSSVFLLEDYAIQSDPIKTSGLVDRGEKRRPTGTVFLGIDLARTNDYTVLYGTEEGTRQNVYFERMNGVAWNDQRRRIRRAVAVLRAAGAEHVVLMVDEGNAGSVIVEDLLDAGYDTVGVNFSTHKSNMVRLLANDLERGKAFVLNDAELDEFTNYQMSMSAAGRIQYSAPDGQHDDVVSAKMLSHWGCVNEGTGDITVITELPEQEPTVERSVDPFAEFEDEDDYSDLLDEAVDDMAEEIGLDPEPTLDDLLYRPHLIRESGVQRLHAPSRFFSS